MDHKCDSFSRKVDASRVTCTGGVLGSQAKLLVIMPVFVTRDYPPAHGGIQRFVAGLASALHAIGEPVWVVAPHHAGDTAFDRSLPFAVTRLEPGNRVAYAVRNARAVHEARSRLRDSRLIASLWQPSGYEALLANVGQPRNVTLIAHGSEIIKQRKGLRKTLATCILRRCNVIAVSRFTAAAVGEFGVTAQVIPPGVTIRSYVRKRAGVPTILAVGRLIRRKGFDRLIEALPDLRRQFSQVHLDIVGDGPDRHYLRELAANTHVETSITFHDGVSDDALHELYARAWCFAMPNRTEGDFDVEGLGIVFLEASLHGIPSIGGRHSGAEDAIVDGSTGILVDGRSLAEVTQALLTILSDSDLADRQGHAARERVEDEFDWRTIARRFVSVIGPAEAT